MLPPLSIMSFKDVIIISGGKIKCKISKYSQKKCNFAVNFTNMYLIVSILSLLVAIAALFARTRVDLMMMQQNSYRINRYRSWQKESGDTSSVSRLMAYICAGITLLKWVPMSAGLVVLALFGVTECIRLFRKKYKKPLVWTARVRRICAVSIALEAVAIAVIALGHIDAASYCLYRCATTAVLLYAVSYFIAIAAVWLLKPVENHIVKKYYDEAASILRSMPDLKIIGITGSYGKTSTKHYLHRILSEQYDTLMTPGNFNTTLGVVRTVREYLKPYNEVFIVEMGAKECGDIKEICDLVHPSIGIVTAVGPQHLESFGSIENVQATKFELVDSLPSDGFAVLNNDFDMIANRAVGNVEAVRYSAQEGRVADYHAVDVKYSQHGTEFTIASADGNIITLRTRLVGRCNVSNLMAAVIVALHMGVSHDKIKYAVGQIEQVEHRLSIKYTPGGLTIIDDAYNSNPVGSAMALEVLAGMTAGRRIVITPGMIELGEDQYRLNREFGAKIPGSADIAIIVGKYNREAIVEGIGKANGLDVHTVDSFAQAQQLLVSMAHAGDTVLYENDLPDTFK